MTEKLIPTDELSAAQQAVAKLQQELHEAFPWCPECGIECIVIGLVAGGNTIITCDRAPLGDAYRLTKATTEAVQGARTLTLAPSMSVGRVPADVLSDDINFLILHDISHFDGEFLSELEFVLGAGPHERRGVHVEDEFKELTALAAVFATVDGAHEEREALAPLTQWFSVGFIV
jgi:hypothetical protein